MAKQTIKPAAEKLSTLEKISNFFKTQKGQSGAKADDEEVDADDEEDTSMKGKNDDDEDEDVTDPADTDKDDDEDDDDDTSMNVSGTVINLKKPAEARAAIEGLMEANEELAQTNATMEGLLKEATKELLKTKEQVKNEIKSSFIVPGSQRSAKTAKVKNELPSFAQLDKDSLAGRAAKLARKS